MSYNQKIFNDKWLMISNQWHMLDDRQYVKVV